MFVDSGKQLDNESLGMAVSDSICSQRSVGLSRVCTVWLLTLVWFLHCFDTVS